MIKYEYYKKKKNFKKILFDFVIIYFFAFLFVNFFNAYFFQAFKIPSNSMEPQLTENSLVLVNKFIYGVKAPFSDNFFFKSNKNIKRGDVIVFYSNEYVQKNKFVRDLYSFIYTLSFSFIDLANLDKNTSNTYIKRVIGLPGDTIKFEINDNKLIVLINDIPEKDIIKKRYFINSEQFRNPISFDINILKNEYKVKENEFYVLGDNRISSVDSRTWNHGINLKQIIGKAVLKYYPKLEVIE